MAPQTDADGTLLGSTVSFLYRSEQVLTGDFEAKVYVFDITIGVRVGLTSDNNTSRGIIYNPRYVKVRRENGTVTISTSVDDITYTEISYDSNTITTEDCKFIFYSYTSGGVYKAIKYKNLMIYSIP